LLYLVRRQEVDILNLPIAEITARFLEFLEVLQFLDLDLIGDFALLGAWPLCEVVAIKSGHRLHASVTRALRARMAEVHERV